MVDWGTFLRQDYRDFVATSIDEAVTIVIADLEARVAHANGKLL